ncbi:MAG: hypothetical protein R3F34_05895 [Planctomycetota bacterium]
MKKRSTIALLAASVALLAGGCVSNTSATGFADLPTVDGRPQEFLGTTTYSLHFLFIVPLIGDGRMQRAVDAFSVEARRRGAENVRIIDTTSDTYWYVFPPISFLFQPVVTSIEGELTMPEDYAVPPPLPKYKRASAKLRDSRGRLTTVESLEGLELPNNAQDAIGSDPFDTPGVPKPTEDPEKPGVPDSFGN